MTNVNKVLNFNKKKEADPSDLIQEVPQSNTCCCLLIRVSQL